MWTQIFGFFALDEILFVMVYAIVREYKRGVLVAGRLPVLVAALAARHGSHRDGPRFVRLTTLGRGARMKVGSPKAMTG